MSTADMEHLRHAEERGCILKALQQEYGRATTTVRSLTGALDLLGFSMSREGMQFSLTYLAESGYVAVTRARDLPGWRTDRVNAESADTIMSARLTPKGLQLVDGLIAADAGVRF